MGFPGDSDESYPETFTKPPIQHEEFKLGMLKSDDLEKLFSDGFVVVEKYFKPEELQPVRHAIKLEVDKLAQKLYKAEKIKSLYKELGLFQRLTKLNQEFEGSAVLLHKIATVPEGIRRLWANDKLLNLAEQVLGTKDIIGHPVWNLRTKVPNVEAVTVPWHQDSAYLDNDSYNVFQLTAWIPLLNTTAENGCMQFMRGGHKKGKVATHTCCHGNTWYVTLEEEEMKNTLDIDLEKDLVTVPVPYGGAVFFNNMIPHRSLNNSSKDIRWSLDLRWQQADKPVGFYGLKEGVLLRSSTDDDLQIDWDGFEAVDRQKASFKAVEEKEMEEFDVTIPGPWMKQWEIVNHNEHTKTLLAEEKENDENKMN